ncbi:MAG: alpha-amylase family glycosyl hydrolase [Bacteroidetes bacterium]|nr:alpha-amylase family glycosyl hydrolase [Bacteroidota bacterium]
MKNISLVLGKLFMMCFFMAFTFVSKATGLKIIEGNNNVTNGITAYPSNWFVQMKWNKVQVLLRSTDIDLAKAKVTINYPGVKLIKVVPFSNTHYVAVDVAIDATAKAGNIPFVVSSGSEKIKIDWALKNRRPGKGTQFAQGINQSDFIYFLMPDRFSNGNPSNDRIAGLKDQTLNRDSIYHRHGGDLQGVQNHLDYMQKMGVTTLWMTPVIENDMPNRTEHGYAFTDHYTIEKRFGGDAAYLQLSDALHARGMKLIQDAVYNHVGRFHFLVQDAPEKDWLHQWPEYTQTNYKDQTVFDPYQSKRDSKRLVDGWFTTEMPDMNHQNEFVANFLIQHALWSVETYGIDAWRIDTYIYNDMPFMNRCNKALLDEYPKLSSFGESMVYGVANQAYFTENNMDIPFKSNLQGAVDFQTLNSGIVPALNEKFGWTDGVNKLYNTLSLDFLYKDPTRNVIFLDNHDMSRSFSVFGESIPKQKMAMAWLMTCRGIPQLYYGTEVLMKGISNPDGWVRLDLPGGWQGDVKSVFTEQGLTNDEKDMLHYTQLLGKYRQSSSAITQGKLMQYLPDDGLYVYFRYSKDQTVMCVMNTSAENKEVNFSNFLERTAGYKGGKDIIGGSSVTSQFTAPAQTFKLIELTK